MNKRAVIEGVNELESSTTPLLEKGGVAAASIRRCEATEEPQTGAKRERDSTKQK
jgi:hypothetical protein